jgi:hypothetical protein
MKKKLFLGLLLLFSIDVFACTCIGKSTVKGALSQSDVVFSGRILSVNFFTVVDDNLPSKYQFKKAEYLVLVKKIHKGDIVSDTLRVITGLGHGDCGIQFSIGFEYIIYSSYSNKHFEDGRTISPFLKTSICTRTMRYNKKELRKIKRVLRKHPEKTSFN